MINWIERLNYAIAYIDKHLCDEIDFNEISRITACPVETVQRFFVLNTGITLTEYIRRRKLYDAFNELKNTDNKVIDIAVKYGYDSPDAFSVAFKRIYGITPTMARNDKNITIQPFLRMIFSLSISYMQGEEIMKSEISEANTLRNTGGNWYKYFYDEVCGWSWSTAYINNLEGGDEGKRLTVRIHPDFSDKWQGFDYKGSKTFIYPDTKSYGIEIYTPIHTKIKTYDTVKIDINGNVVIGGDTILNIIGEVIQAGNSEYMIGRYDNAIKDNKGNIVSDEIISAEMETYGDGWLGGNWEKYKQRQEDPKRWAILRNWPWHSFDDDNNITLHIKDGTKVICHERTHKSNIDGILNGETTTAGFIRLDNNCGKIKLSNGVTINAPKNTIVSVEYESGECTITVGNDNATITKPESAEITVSRGTFIDNEGNIMK